MQARLEKLFGVFVVLVALITTPLSALAEEIWRSEGYVAMVNGSVITIEDFNRAMKQVEQRLAGAEKDLGVSQRAEIKKEVLEKLINRELLYQKSQKDGFKVTSAEVDDQLSRIRRRFSSEEEFKRALGYMGFTEKNIEYQIRRGIEIQRFVDHNFAQKAAVAEKEIKAYYKSHPGYFKQPEQVRASHILIKVAPDANDFQKAEARSKIEMIRQMLKEGEDFAALARAYSKGPSNANDGDLGYFRRGEKAMPFETAAFALEPGDVSGIIETDIGFHLIKVVDKKSEASTGYGKARGKIAQYMKQKQVQKMADEYAENIKRSATIERFLTENH
ncbi:peptidylprolyl isomerase [Thermodesulfobacteriota bacterium]